MKINLEKIKNVKTNNNTSGITLIALVVTIVVLLILAGITINMLFSENGIITKAREAAEKTAQAEQNDIQGMQNMVDQMDELINGENSNDEEVTPTVTLESLMTTTSDKNETVKDVYGNKIVVPAGFKIVAHGTDNVEYTYDKKDGVSTNKPVVQDGIVIKNATDENQFVWIPVGTIKNDAVENTTNTTTIQLGRYIDFTMGEDGTLPTPAQVASKTDYDTPTPINTNYIEISNSFAGGTSNGTEYKAASEYTDSNGNTNTKAYNLQEWITTTIDNGGYYIARYEASKNGEKAASKVSTGTPLGSGVTNPVINDGMLWNYITQPSAATAARKAYEYSENAKYYSDLINSYAWDTAIIFIQAYSGDTDYATQDGNSINSSIANTGINNDKKCNIHDMAGNVSEWTTETNAYSNAYSGYPCTYRGGYCNSRNCTTDRDYYTASYSSNYVSFRLALCVK